MRDTIRQLTIAITLSALLLIPVPALAAVNPDPQSAATAGIQFLAAHQQTDGSISGLGGESEWSTEAVQAGGLQAATFAHGGSSLLDFLRNDVPGAGTPATTLERKIIAIAAAGQNPASFGGVNYESLLDAQHQSGQLGDQTLLNDDAFGIIAIDAAHDSSLTPTAQDALDYLLVHQGADGGFSYTTASCAYCGDDNNDTAAALIAMYAADDLGLTNAGLSAAKTAALNYLLSTQQADGGFAYDQFSPSDGSSTAWSLMALNTLGDAVSFQAAQARTWLLNNQNPDGGFSFGAYGTTTSDTYTTAHAVTALLGSTWLLRPAPLPIGQIPVPAATTGGSGGGTAAPAATSTAATAAAAVSNNDTVAASQPENNDTSVPASDAEVKGANTVGSAVPKAKKPTATTGHNSRYAAYAAGLLCLVALIWFMLESRKPKGADNEN